MEVQLDKRYPLPVSPEQAWVILSDIRAVAACMPGAQITEQSDETHFKGLVKSKVGPAVMTFNGDIELLGRDVSQRRLEILGKGADKAGSSASMNLAARIENGDTRGSSVLIGLATITVNGKLAQFGGRLLVPVADAMLAQFADNFRVAAEAVPPPAGVGATAASSSGQPPAPRVAPRELNALGLMWMVIKGWFAGLFGKKAA
ncbi:SRPBCC family protein [Methylibium sp.]|uniref:SRPBCC family protein n=1 Tax=Methylibium sp. TaxID=2067992 RepID=UPI003D09A3CD